MSFPTVPQRNLPAHLELLYPRGAIERRIIPLAQTMDTWAARALLESEQPLLVICVLRGGVFFFSDLLQQMTASVEPGFCRASSYAVSENGAPQKSLSLDWLNLNPSGRHVVLVDNICDSGRTLAACTRQLEATSAKSVRSVVCVHRLRSDTSHSPTLAGFTFNGPEWLAGYGLRDRNSLMNAPEIYRVRTIYPK